MRLQLGFGKDEADTQLLVQLHRQWERDDYQFRDGHDEHRNGHDEHRNGHDEHRDRDDVQWSAVRERKRHHRPDDGSDGLADESAHSQAPDQQTPWLPHPVADPARTRRPDLYFEGAAGSVSPPRA
jgi:hypothetical protein